MCKPKHRFNETLVAHVSTCFSCYLYPTQVCSIRCLQAVVADLTATLGCDPDDTQQPSKRCREQLELFESLVNSYWFSKVPVILYLNKKDIFEQHPLEYSFPNYTGGPNFKAAIDRILSRLYCIFYLHISTLERAATLLW
jgi:hypothetical protein